MGLRSETLPLRSLNSRVRAEWLDLTGKAQADLSMAPQWFESTVRSRGVAERAHVFTVSDGDKLVGLVSFIVGRETSAGFSARSRESPGSFLVAYHPEIVGVIEPEVLLQLYVKDCSRVCDVIALPNLDRAGPTAVAAAALAKRMGLTCLARAGHSSPFLSISGDWEKFLGTKNKKFRYKVRTGLKTLEQAGVVTNTWFSAATEVETLLAEMLRIEEKSWKMQAGMAVSTSAMEREYYRLLLPFIAGQGALHANVLYLDSVPIAYSLGYVSNGSVRQLKTSFDQRYAPYSPGAVCHQLAIRRAFEIGAREFDFLGDTMQHKGWWASGIREHVSLYLFLPTWRGMLLGNLRQAAGWLRGRGGSRGTPANDERVSTDSDAPDAEHGAS